MPIQFGETKNYALFDEKMNWYFKGFVNKGNAKNPLIYPEWTFNVMHSKRYTNSNYAKIDNDKIMQLAKVKLTCKRV